MRANINMLSCFDEMLKIAISVDDLRKAYRRLAPTRLPRPNIPLYGGMPAPGPGIIPTLSQAKRQASNVKRIAAQLPEEIGEGLSSLAEHGVSRSAQRGGEILMTPGGLSRTLKETGLGGPSTGSAKKVINLVGGLHEGYERGVKPSQVAPFSSHLSPDVLYKEHNLLRSLTGPGAEEARKHISDVREQLGELSHLRGYMKEHYGPRFSLDFGRGQKITKAMRKDLNRKIQAQQAAASYEGLF